jgi:hypothetical protein
LHPQFIRVQAMDDTKPDTRLDAALDASTISDEEIALAKRVSLATVKRWARLKLLPPKCGPGREARRNRAAVERALSGVA